MRKLIFTLIAAACVASIPYPVSAGTILVPSDFSTIQAALDAAAAGDVILVADGTYLGAGNKDLDFHGKSLTLRSENGPTPCIIDCEGSGRGFYFAGGGNQVLEGFTILNGYADWGGAIYCASASSPLIRNCRFIGNQAYLGGGVCVDASSAVISGCQFSGNTAWLHGGGVYVLNSTSPSLEDSVFSGNEAYVGGGGILSYSSSLKIINCLVEGNSADDYGGGICANHSTLTLVSSTISDNITYSSGGGIDVYDTSLTVKDSIVWGNSAGTGEQLALSTASSAGAEYSDMEGGAAAAYVEAGSTLAWGTGNKDANPIFVSGPLGAYYLSQAGPGESAVSPCIDAGSGSAAELGFDAYTTRTDHRSDTGTVDMGHHRALLTQILLFFPADKASFSSPPTFRWTADGETDNGYSVDIKFGSSPWYSTYQYLKITIDGTSWTIPETSWKKIPVGSTVKWRVRGADLDQAPRTIITSEDTLTFYKK
jgi:predicted outer membrane repeat protein